MGISPDPAPSSAPRTCDVAVCVWEVPHQLEDRLDHCPVILLTLCADEVGFADCARLEDGEHGAGVKTSAVPARRLDQHVGGDDACDKERARVVQGAAYRTTALAPPVSELTMLS